MRSAFFALAVAITRAPRAAASWTSRPPVTPPAPLTTTQPPLASSEPPVHKQCLPGGQPAHRQSCRLDVAQPQGLRCKHIGWDDGVLGSHAVAIERRKRIYLVTAADDNARKLVRRNRRQSIDRPLQLVTCNRP